MTVYLVLMLLCGALGLLICEKGGKKAEYICIIVIVLLLSLLAALRSGNVGVDFDWIYRDYFLNVRQNLRLDYIFSAQNPYRREFIFTLFNMAVALFTAEPLVLWGLSSVVITVLQAVFFIRYSKKPWLCLYLYIALGFFGYSLCYIRQMMAVSIALFALPFLEKRRPLPYFAIVLAAGFIHNSLFLMLPLYFLAILPLNRITAALYTAGFGVVLIFSDDILKMTARLFPHFGIYVESGAFSVGTSFRHALLWMLIMAIALLCYPALKSRKENCLPLFNLCLFGTFSIMLITKSVMYQRVSLVLLPFFTLLIPELICALQPVSNTKQLKYADKKRFYLTMLVLFMTIAAFQLFFLYSIDSLGIFPYSPFWR